MRYDVAIVGGGPAGSALGTLVRKYAPDLHVAIFERETFPREHVGESLLPSACKVLDEMGAWSAVEAADFPIKIGATYRWGASPALWDFEFLPASQFREEPRPGRFEGIRARTAFQVDRAKFDQILLNQARGAGCHVHEETRIARLERAGDAVCSLTTEAGDRVEAKYFVDASGNSGILRRAMEVEIQAPTSLQNVAFWAYWENTEWAVSIGTTATRILILSLSWGWVWFIPLGGNRTSIGLVCPAEFYKQSGASPEALYLRALDEEPKIQELCRGASRQTGVYGTKDWSFLADRLAGENWFLCGESAGFADPILSAGVTLALTGARELAFTLIELLKGEEDAAWLKTAYDKNQRARIRQHIRFADFWYSANGQFSDLKEFTRQIAADAGLSLDADEAFRWLGTGGFTNDVTQLPTIADISVAGVRLLTQRFTDTSAPWALEGVSVVRLNLDGAQTVEYPLYDHGGVRRIKVLERHGKKLPGYGLFGILLDALRRHSRLESVAQTVAAQARGGPDPLPHVFQILEVWIADGWVEAVRDPRFPAYTRPPSRESGVIHDNRDVPMP